MLATPHDDKGTLTETGKLDKDEKGREGQRYRGTMQTAQTIACFKQSRHYNLGGGGASIQLTGPVDEDGTTLKTCTPCTEYTLRH